MKQARDAVDPKVPPAGPRSLADMMRQPTMHRQPQPQPSPHGWAQAMQAAAAMAEAAAAPAAPPVVGATKRKGLTAERVELGQFQGRIKSFSEKNGFGFIDCADLKTQGFNDVFLHHLEIGGFAVGDVVCFSAYLSNKGQPQAKNLVQGLSTLSVIGGAGILPQVPVIGDVKRRRAI